MANDYVGWGLILGIEDSLDEFINDATKVVNSLGTGLPPRDLAAFSSQSTESGIQLTFTPPAQTYIDDGGTDQFAVMPAGVLIRYSDTGYPRTPDEGVFGYDYKPTGDWVTTSQTCTIVGLTKDTKYYFTAFPYSTEHVYNKNQVTANRTEMTWVGNKGTISVTVNTPEGYEGTLGEYTITLVDQAESGGQDISETATGAGLTQFGGLEGGKTYKVRLSNTSDLQAPADSEAITVVGGVNYNVTMTYALMYGTITVNVSTQPAGMPIGAYTVTLTPNDGTGALQQSGNNSQAVTFSNVKNGVVYTVGLSAINHYTANAGGTVTAVGGQNVQHNAHYGYNATLSEASWSEISAIAKSGNARNVFSIGDEKNLTISTHLYKVLIVGFDHDANNSITFQTRTINENVCFMTNGSSVSAITATDIYDKLVEIYESMPADIKPYILNVDKPYNTLLGGSYQNQGLTSFSYFLFPFSEIEIFGTQTHSWNRLEKEGSMYEFFTNSERRSIGGDYWTRTSAGNGTSYYVCYVTGSGGANTASRSTYKGVNFGFCIG